MSKDELYQEKGKFIIGNVCLVIFAVPFVLHLMQVKVSFKPLDYETYLWFFALTYGIVTYGYVCDRIQDMLSFVLIFTVQIHSALFFFIQKIFPLTILQKIVLTTYLISICMFMNLMVLEYRNVKKDKDKKNLMQTRLVFIVNQCSGTIFAQMIFLVLGIIDIKNYEVVLKLYPWDLATYAIFNLLSLFGLCTGLYLVLFKMESLKKKHYSLQQHWFYFTGLFAFFCFMVLKWDASTIYEQYILVSAFFYLYIITLDLECEKWFFILSIILGLGQIAIQVLYQSQFHDIWIHICAGLNNLFMLYLIIYKIKECFSQKK